MEITVAVSYSNYILQHESSVFPRGAQVSRILMECDEGIIMELLLATGL